VRIAARGKKRKQHWTDWYSMAWGRGKHLRQVIGAEDRVAGSISAQHKLTPLITKENHEKSTEHPNSMALWNS